MNRLIQGDVGSGKTVVAELASVCCGPKWLSKRHDGADRNLAKQHVQSLTADFEKIWNLCRPFVQQYESSREKRDAAAIGDRSNPNFVGTHAVIQPDVIFKNLGMVITDEQHRFGVNQRSLLSKKAKNPNILVMTATPIPRTLAVIIYGDLDIFRRLGPCQGADSPLKRCRRIWRTETGSMILLKNS